MCQTGRLFNCACCHSQTIICNHCDRGQIYCHTECSEQARQASMRAANARYQQTQKGKHNHADRQRRYRQNQKKVTYQGSPKDTARDVLPPSPIKEKNALTGSNTQELFCHFCQKPISRFLRNRFLTPTERYRPAAVAKTT